MIFFFFWHLNGFHLLFFLYVLAQLAFDLSAIAMYGFTLFPFTLITVLLGVKSKRNYLKYFIDTFIFVLEYVISLRTTRLKLLSQTWLKYFNSAFCVLLCQCSRNPDKSFFKMTTVHNVHIVQTSIEISN